MTDKPNDLASVTEAPGRYVQTEEPSKAYPGAGSG